MSRKSQHKSEVFRFYLLVTVVMLFVAGIAWLSYIINQTQLSTDTKASGFYRNYFSTGTVRTTAAPTPRRYASPYPTRMPTQDVSRGQVQQIPEASLAVTCLQAENTALNQWDISWGSRKPSDDYAISVVVFKQSAINGINDVTFLRFIPKNKVYQALATEYIASYKGERSSLGGVLFGAVQVTNPQMYGEQPTSKRLLDKEVMQGLRDCQTYYED